MPKTKKETATAVVRIYPSSRRRLNIKAAKESKTLAQIIDELSLRNYDNSPSLNS